MATGGPSAHDPSDASLVGPAVIMTRKTPVNVHTEGFETAADEDAGSFFAAWYLPLF